MSRGITAARPTGGSRGEPSSPPTADTFPKLLIRNARTVGDRPAMRHKDLGIWQTWTWARVAATNVRAYAVGLHRLGAQARRHHRHRRRQPAAALWSVMAAQMLGAIPVPVYADAVADELSYVLAHAEVAFAAVEDQEQVDKILSVLGPPAEARDAWSTTRPRGLRDYDHANLHAIDDVIADGRKALAADPQARRPGSMPRSPPARAPTPRSSSTPPAPPGSPRAWCCPPSAASPPRPTPSPSTS